MNAGNLASFDAVSIREADRAGYFARRTVFELSGRMAYQALEITPQAVTKKLYR